MSTRYRLVLAFTFTSIVAASACGGDDESSSSGGGSGGSAGSADASGATIKVGATFVDYVSQQPIEGLEICTLIPTGRNPGCASTGPTGQIVAEGFPTFSDVLFKLTKDGYYTTLIPATTADQDDTGEKIFPVKQSDVELLLTGAGLTQEAGKAAISFIAGKAGTEDGLADVSVVLSPPGGTLAYLNGLSLDATATQTDQNGLGVILNLDPDVEYTLTFTHNGTPAQTCKTRLGWVTGTETASKAPTQADMITYVLNECAP